MEFNDYTKISVANDVVILTSEKEIQDNKRTVAKQGLQVLLVKRTDSTYTNTWALPGGFVDADKGLTECTMHKLKEKTGLSNVYLEQLKTYGDNLVRDPRGRVISVAYMALATKQGLSGLEVNDRTAWFWLSMKRDNKHNVVDVSFYKEGEDLVLNDLAFDHKQMVIDAINRIKNKVEYTDVVFSLMPRYFTIRDLQTVYEAILGYQVYSFRRRIGNKVIQTNKVTTGDAHRPAALFEYNQGGK